MPKMFSRILTMFIIALAPHFAFAQETQQDVIGAVIVQLFQTNNGKFLCLNSASSLPEIRKTVEAQLQNMGKWPTLDQNDVAKAIYKSFPCPFSPYRNELRLATENDIEGVWLYPEESQKFRFGPKSAMWAKHSSIPIRCESVAYYAGGEARNAQMVGRMACPFSTAKDMDASRANPKVSSWEMLESGMLKISRTDVQNHTEEWEVFAVVSPFSIHKVEFKEGDLVSYLRKENGNDFFAATVFRHLRRLR